MKEPLDRGFFHFGPRVPQLPRRMNTLSPGPQRRAETAGFVLLAALFALPFCSVARVTPNPAFWGEWLAVLLFALWWLTLALARPADQAPQRTLSVVTVTFVSLALLTLVQAGLLRTRFVSEALLASTLLLLAALASHNAQRLHADGHGARLAQAVAFGLVVALWLNALGVALGFAGYGIVFGHLVPVVKDLRSVGFIGQANQLAVLSVMAIAAVVSLRLRGKLPRWFAWLTFVVAAMVCATTGSRTGPVVFAAMVVLYAWRALPRHSAGALPARWRALTAAAVLFTGIQLAWTWIVQLQHSGVISALRGGDAGRTEMLADAWQLWLAHPLLGVGYGNYAPARLFELDGPMPAAHADHAHNLAAQVLAEWGLAGALPVAAALAVLTWALLRRRATPSSTVEQAFFAMGVTALLIHSLVEYPLWLANFLLPFAVLAGALEQSVLPLPGRTVVRLRWVPVVGALTLMAGCAFAAWDYLRSQNMALRMKSQIGAGQYVVANVSFAEATRVAVGTLFPVHAEIMQVRTLPLDGDFAEYRLALARQALIAVPSGETVARYAAHAALANHFDEGLALMASMRRRNRLVHDKALEFLSVLSGADPRIAEMHDRALAGALR